MIWILGFLAACVIVYLNVVATWMLFRSQVVSAFQRGAQFVLIWIVPLIGAIVVISILTDPKDRRRRLARWTPDSDGGGENAGDFNTQHGHHGGHSGDGGHGGDGGGGDGGGDGGGGGH